MSQKTLQKNILTFLVEHSQQSFSINELARHLQKDYKNVHENIKTLPSVSIQKSAGAKLVSFNHVFSELLFQVEQQRKNNVLKDKNLRVIYNDLYKVNTQYILLLFGSRAKKTNRAQSDYDFLLISDTPKKIERALSLYPITIHLHTFSLDEFTQSLLSKEFTVVSEAIKNNVILFGIEDYYRLLQNAK